MSMRHFLVPLLLAALGFAVGQVVPGLGMGVVILGTFIWIGIEQRRAKRLGLTCNKGR